MNGNFETLLSEAVKAKGDKYRSLRTQIMELDAESAKPLAQKKSDSDWHVSLIAGAMEAWRSDANHIHFLRRIANGKDPSLKPEEYMTGVPPVEIAAAKYLEESRVGVLPLLELVYKETDSATDYLSQVCSDLVIQTQEQRAIPVYRELFGDQDLPTDHRDRCIRPLIELKADGLFDDLSSVYENTQNDPELRAAALSSVGEVDDPRSLPLLERSLRDSELAIDYRKAAAIGLGETGNADAVGLLVEQYRTTTERGLKEEIVFSLGTLGLPEAIEPLKQIYDTETDRLLKETIEDTIHDLEGMLE